MRQLSEMGSGRRLPADMSTGGRGQLPGIISEVRAQTFLAAALLGYGTISEGDKRRIITQRRELFLKATICIYVQERP